MPLSNARIEELLMLHLRLYHHPVGVTFLFSDEDVEAFKAAVPDYVLPARPLTYCQWEVGARMKGLNVLGTVEKLFCTNAQVSFGWRDIDENEVKSQLKYCRDVKQARRFLEAKPRLPLGSIRAIAVQPLHACTGTPHVVRMFCDNIQVYHLAIDYMAAMDISPLPTQILMSSSSCAGSAHCWLKQTFNATTPCSGAYNSGKMERTDINVFIPGSQIARVVERMLERVTQKGTSAITTPGDYYPGADVCKNCPLIHFRKNGQSCGTCTHAPAAETPAADTTC